MKGRDSLQAEIDALRADNTRLKQQIQLGEEQFSILKNKYEKKCALVEVVGKILLVK